MNIDNKTPHKGIFLLPNLFTTAALFSGFYAIIAAVNDKFEIAAIAIFIAMVLDGLDGRVARLTNTQSEFGAQYDSLADLVSFGLAPSLVVYLWALVHMKETSIVWGKLGWMAAFIYVACAALRLARFNVQQEEVDSRYFIGLPSPASAALMLGMVWLCSYLNISGDSIQIPALLMTLFAGLLMVSNVKFHSFKGFDFRSKVPHLFVLVIALVFALVAIAPPIVLFGVFLLYAFSGPVIWLMENTPLKKLFNKNKQ